jgi:hypothetical protein
MSESRFVGQSVHAVSGGHATSATAAILSGGLSAGILDTLLAMLLWHVSPITVYKSVAGGWLGKTAFHGGFSVIVLGMFSHFLIATGAATVYWIASQTLGRVAQNMIRYWFPSGLLYGVVVYYVMDLVVVPLSRMPEGGPPEPTWRVIGSIVGHMFLVGLPIAFFANRHSKAVWPITNSVIP